MEFIIIQVITFVKTNISMNFQLKIVLISFLFIGKTSLVLSQNQTNENEIINAFIEKKRTFNKVHNFGYRIQLFNGKEAVVLYKEDEFKKLYPTIKTYIEYDPPEWKIQVSHFKTKLAADQFLSQLKNDFPAAIIVPLSK